MVFSSLVFIFAYLVLTLLIYYITPRKFRNLFLLLVNLVFYGWGEPLLVWLMVINIIINYAGGLLVYVFGRHGHPALKKLALILTIVIDIGVLAVFKYSGMFVETVNFIFSANFTVPEIALPIGISFYTFQTMSYVIDVYRDDAPVSKNPINFGTYVSLFPQLIAGPIVRYRDVAYQLRYRRETLDRFTKGVKLFAIGLGKKVLIANQMGILTTQLLEHPNERGMLGAWIGIIAFTFQIYFDFSGYSDMACGLGNMFGFEFLKNFNYPYISSSITDFWRRWHISLSTWFKEYVYIPLGGNRKGVFRQILNLLIVWSLTGLWHGASYNFIFWGLFYGLLLILEKFVLKRFVLDHLPKFFQHFYALFIVLIGWSFFFFTDLSQLGAFFGDFFCIDFFAFNGSFEGFVTETSLNLTLSYLPLLVAAGVASTPLGANLYAKVKDKKYIWIAETAFVAAIQFISTASLVNQSYNPFLYFRF